MARDRNLVIDTGPDHPTSLEAMRHAGQKIGLDWNRTDLFVTHFHSDHFGLVSKLASENSKIYFNRYEAERYKTWGGIESMAAYFIRHGFPEGAVQKSYELNKYKNLSDDWLADIESVGDGDQFDFEPFKLACIHTPGHSHGHMCLYETDLRLLFCGDHILSDISPSVMCWSDDDNPLAAYLDSLNKIRDLDVNIAFPGHREVIQDHRRIIDEIQRHHVSRLNEVLNILSENAFSSGYQLASKMRWKYKAGVWEDFPGLQKFLATAEAIAHLRYLEESGKVAHQREGEKVAFFITDGNKR